MSKTDNVVSFVGGMRYGASGGVFSGGFRLSWPLAVLELHRDKVSLSPRGLFKKVFGPVDLPLAAISEVETGFGISKAGIRFRLAGPDDGTVFWASAGTKPLIVDALCELGLHIVEAPSRDFPASRKKDS